LNVASKRRLTCKACDETLFTILVTEGMNGAIREQRHPRGRSKRRMNRKRWLLIALMASMMLLTCVAMWGQATATATLQGTVTDKSQAVIKSAEVTITNKDTGATRTVTTSDTGEYRLDV